MLPKAASDAVMMITNTEDKLRMAHSFCRLHVYRTAIAKAAKATGNDQAQSARNKTAAAATTHPTRKPTNNRKDSFNRSASTRLGECLFDNSPISDRVALVKLPLITAVETTLGNAKRSKAYWQAIAETAIITAVPAANPLGFAEGLVMTVKIRTVASNRNWTTSRSRPKLGPWRCDASAISQTTARANMKTGIAKACAVLNGPACTSAAAATTRLPVT